MTYKFDSLMQWWANCAPRHTSAPRKLAWGSAKDFWKSQKNPVFELS